VHLTPILRSKRCTHQSIDPVNVFSTIQQDDPQGHRRLRFSFFLHLSKSKHPKMQFPKTTAPHSGFTRLEPPACQGNIGATNFWQRRDEPDLRSLAFFVNPVLSRTGSTLTRTCLASRLASGSAPVTEEVLAPPTISGGVDGRFISPAS
ncbi:hypothetical protein, partial [Microvirga solisilvae]|uniref:hypothetical protein n=1 Tax=Microvirga solisilvae TaxID=2919498 RepID=UPI001FAF7316